MEEPSYASVVVSRVHLAVAVVFAAAAAVAAAIDGQWWLGVLLAVVFLALGVHLGVVRLTVTSDSVRAGQGPWGGGREIPRAELTEAQVVELSFAQVLGARLPENRRIGRLTVRPGPTLQLVLGSGEYLWVTTADPATAARAVRPTAAT
jgi:hypothetical protein